MYNVDFEIIIAWDKSYFHSVNHPSKLILTILQKNKLKSFMRNTNNKKEYRRLLAILQKVEGRSYVDIANEHGVSSRSV
ncbi:MAG: helix-turn-helix domain-containing protein, partial [Nitrososphaeraceae archaeon]